MMKKGVPSCGGCGPTETIGTVEHPDCELQEMKNLGHGHKPHCHCGSHDVPIHYPLKHRIDEKNVLRLATIIAGGALGSLFGPGGTLAGATLGAESDKLLCQNECHFKEKVITTAILSGTLGLAGSIFGPIGTMAGTLIGSVAADIVNHEVWK
jgi:hypothetical protein